MPEYNPFPEFGCIMLEDDRDQQCQTHLDDLKVLKTNFFSQKETTIQNHGKTLKYITKKGIQFKTVIGDDGEIYVVYVDFLKEKSDIEVKTLPEINDNDSHDLNESMFDDDQIRLNMITLGKIHLKYFITDEPAILLNDKIYVKDEANYINYLDIKNKNFAFKSKDDK